ncbi:voltage-dependent calcium channel gamma-4 subunit-like protein [Lates japonicus]|uniref:Voltage-dependent calcium channel gamma-4 subunit-like protein n=1 Tax=Lates japonicus TaxID=270547 RepID=A0AAD3MR05_LATJO|nr:voltage-dependent calcium channel gamma-4 subunit-like protein [Lates japonicus]
MEAARTGCYGELFTDEEEEEQQQRGGEEMEAKGRNMPPDISFLPPPTRWYTGGRGIQDAATMGIVAFALMAVAIGTDYWLYAGPYLQQLWPTHPRRTQQLRQERPGISPLQPVEEICLEVQLVVCACGV